jgi:hypothetical protein
MGLEDRDRDRGGDWGYCEDDGLVILPGPSTAATLARSQQNTRQQTHKPRRRDQGPSKASTYDFGTVFLDPPQTYSFIPS